jgi:hypothetical protein
MNATQIIEKVQSGSYRLVQAAGTPGFTVERLHKGQWLVGVRISTNAGRAAASKLQESKGVHYTFWYGNNGA